MKTVHDCFRVEHADMPKRILFVDDEPMVLHGLQGSPRPMRTNWEMVFAAGGPEALIFDIVVTDMRMPGLAIAHSVIVKKHDGQIWFDSEVGKGTTFFVRLPLVASSQTV